MKRSVRLTWHLSYAALLSVPILIFILVSWGTSRALEDQLETSSATLVDLMGKEIDGKLEYVSRLINDVTWDPLAQSLMNLTDLDTGAQRFDMVRLADRLSLSAGYSRFSDFVFIAFPNLASVLIPTSQYTEDQFFLSYFQGSGMSRQGFHDFLARRHEGDSTPLVYVDALGHQQNAVAIVKSLPPSPSSPAAANIGVLIHTDTIVASLHATVKDSRSEIQILNDRGEVIVGTLKGPWTPGTGSGVRMGGEDYTVLQRQTEKFGWTVQLLVPDSSIKGNLLFAQLVILVGLASCLVLGVWLTAYLVRRNYGPVSRVLEALSTVTPRGQGPEDQGDEFSQIHRTVSLVRDRLEQSKEPLRQNLAAGLLRGRAETAISLQDRLSALGIVFLTNEFVVYLVQLDAELGTEATAVLHREVEAGFEGLGTTLLASQDSPLTFLINLHAASTPQTLAALQESVTSWAPQYGCASAFSSVVQGVGSIPTAWAQAKTALEYRFVVGGAYPFAWDQLKVDRSSPFSLYDGEREGRLLTVIKAGEGEAAVGLLNQMLDENARLGTMLSPLAIQCLVWDVVATMMKALAEVSEGDESFTTLFLPVPALAQSNQWDRVRAGLVALVTESCTHARQQNSQHLSQLKSTANRQFVQRVCDYLQQQFRDPSLDLTKIADAHGLTPAYLSRLFRENAEEGIFDFLHRVRIENAKSLLRSGLANLHEVGLASGFVDVKTFIRNFRRFTGITPGKYRESAK